MTATNPKRASQGDPARASTTLKADMTEFNKASTVMLAICDALPPSAAVFLRRNFNSLDGLFRFELMPAVGAEMVIKVHPSDAYNELLSACRAEDWKGLVL